MITCSFSASPIKKHMTKKLCEKDAPGVRQARVDASIQDYRVANVITILGSQAVCVTDAKASSCFDIVARSGS